MNITVCMKQVPSPGQVETDPETGRIVRRDNKAVTNPFDLYALETGLRLREQLGGKVTVITMGPQSAEIMMRDAYSMGADEAVILSDPAFAGSDVLATAYTLSEGIRAIEDTDIIICGRQTTDGDTAQVGPAIAEYLKIPHCAWISEIRSADDEKIVVRQDFSYMTQISEMKYPCLITVDKDICVPRLPSYILKKKSAGRDIRVIGADELRGLDINRCGMDGSATRVVRMFSPPPADAQVYLEGSPKEKAEKLFESLVKGKII